MPQPVSPWMHLSSTKRHSHTKHSALASSRRQKHKGLLLVQQVHTELSLGESCIKSWQTFPWGPINFECRIRTFASAHGVKSPLPADTPFGMSMARASCKQHGCLKKRRAFLQGNCIHRNHKLKGYPRKCKSEVPRVQTWSLPSKTRQSCENEL